jgi:hypothetical protein
MYILFYRRVDDVGRGKMIHSDADAIATVEGGDLSPRMLGSIVAAEIIFDMQTDGWNYDGYWGKDGQPCTDNFRPYTDSTG